MTKANPNGRREGKARKGKTPPTTQPKGTNNGQRNRSLRKVSKNKTDLAGRLKHTHMHTRTHAATNVYS